MSRKAKKTLSRSKRLLKRLHQLAKNHFIPHPGNNHVPHVLHHKALFGYSVILIALKVVTVGVGLAFPGYSLFSSAITPTNIISLTNQTRNSLGLETLTVDTRLSAAAQAKAEDMFLNSYFAHTSPTGVTPWYWIRSTGYNYRSAGENLAAHFSEAEDVEAGWMASPTHRENIVSDRYNEIGVGVVQGVFEEHQTTFVVQMFGYEIEQAVEEVSEPVTGVEGAEMEASPSPSLAGGEPETSPVNVSNVVVTPIENGYAVKLDLPAETEATLNLGSEQVPFVESETVDVKQSVALYNPYTISDTGEKLSITTQAPDGTTEQIDLAWVMPGAGTPEVYAFKAGERPKLLGVMDVANVDDNVHKVFLFTLIFLGAMLCIGIFVKIEHQRPTMIAHSLAVIALAFLLTIT